MNTREQQIQEIAEVYAKLSSERKKQLVEIIAMIVKHPGFYEELVAAMQESEPSQFFEVAKELMEKWREKVA